tara:strand:+ start:4405 stop:6549 length:2145 start_codon:yes stop_codon:yes gene_type:complete
MASYDRLKGDAYHFNAQAALILFTGAAAAIVCSRAACLARSSCIDSGNCLEGDQGVCAFSNKVVVGVAAHAAYASTTRSASAYATYASNASSDALALVLRGVCSPGERQQRSALSGQVECTTNYPFPDSINHEITDASASQPHRQACGKWIDAGGYVQDVQYFSMMEHPAWLSALEQAENASTLSAHTATTQASKFRAMCDRTVHSGPAALRTAGTLAYRQLAERVQTVSTRNEVLRASGFLSSVYCDNSVRMGMYLSVSGKFVLDLVDGWQPASGVLANALHLAGESLAVQQEAEAARDAVHAIADSLASPAISASDISEVMRGALDREQLGRWYYSAGAMGTNMLDSLVSYFESGNVDPTRSYLRGIAAFCAVELRAPVDRLGSLTNEMHRIRGARPPASALGRLHTESEEVSITNETVFEASAVTLGQLQSSTGDAGIDCLGYMRGLFPDDMDAMRFDATVAPHLYERLEPMVAATRSAMQQAWLTPPLSAVVQNASIVSEDTRVAGIRIAGAPRGSWAGIKRPIPRGRWSSNDGLFAAAIQQARALFKDRFGELVIGGADPCDHPPLYASATLKAYMVYTLRCSVLFLGMAHRPYLDAQYDNASLASGGVFVIAHELGHLSLNSPYTAFYSSLLSAYQPSVLREAIADVSGAFGVLRAGLVTGATFMLGHCQRWCGRVPRGYSPAATASHPPVNDRCDHLRQTLLPYFSV